MKIKHLYEARTNPHTSFTPFLFNNFAHSLIVAPLVQISSTRITRSTDEPTKEKD